MFKICNTDQSQTYLQTKNDLLKNTYEFTSILGKYETKVKD